MASLMLPYAAISLLLLGIAIVEHTNATTLSLPLSPSSTILTIILPIISFLNTIYFSTSTTTTIRQIQPSSSSSTTSSLLAQALQLLQVIITTVLGTTFLTDALPSSTTQCLLSTRWQAIWTGHDAATIRRVQDALDCCGFNSVVDRAWPFPNKGNPQPACAAQFGRTGSCAAPWSRAMRIAGGVEFGVVAAIGVLQLINILLLRYISSRGRRSSSSSNAGWVSSAIKCLTAGGDDEHTAENRSNLTRPLLENGSGPEEDDEQPRSRAAALNDADEAYRRVARPETGTNNGYGATTHPHTGVMVPRVDRNLEVVMDNSPHW